MAATLFRQNDICNGVCYRQLMKCIHGLGRQLILGASCWNLAKQKSEGGFKKGLNYSWDICHLCLIMKEKIQNTYSSSINPKLAQGSFLFKFGFYANCLIQDIENKHLLFPLFPQYCLPALFAKLCFCCFLAAALFLLLSN